jgi:hypothetical protein
MLNEYNKDSNLYLDALDRYKQNEQDRVKKENEKKISKSLSLFQSELQEMDELNVFFDKYNTDTRYTNSLNRKRKIIETALVETSKKKHSAPTPPPSSPEENKSTTSLLPSVSNLFNRIKEDNNESKYDSDDFDDDFEEEKKIPVEEQLKNEIKDKPEDLKNSSFSLPNPFNMNVNMHYPSKDKHYNEMRQEYGYKLTPIQTEIINDNDFLRSVYYFAKLVCTHKIFNWENQIWNTFDIHPDRVITKAFYTDFVNTLSDEKLKIKLERIFQPDLFTSFAMAVDLINENRLNASKSKIRLSSFLNNPSIYTYFAKYIQLKLQTSFRKVFKHQFDVLEKERLACFLAIVKLEDKDII